MAAAEEVEAVAVVAVAVAVAVENTTRTNTAVGVAEEEEAEADAPMEIEVEADQLSRKAGPTMICKLFCGVSMGNRTRRTTIWIPISNADGSILS